MEHLRSIEGLNGKITDRGFAEYGFSYFPKRERGRERERIGISSTHGSFSMAMLTLPESRKCTWMAAMLAMLEPNYVWDMPVCPTYTCEIKIRYTWTTF